VAQLRAVDDPDLWWHLRGGAMVLDQGRWWLEETGSWLQSGTWWDTEWLFQVALYGVHAVGGGAGIAASIAGMAALCAWLTTRKLADAALPLAVLAQVAVFDHWAPRPQSWMLVGLALATTLGPRLAPWLVLQLAWSHLHASHVLLPAVAAAGLVEALIQRQNVRSWLQITLGCATLALLANPLGPGVITEVLDHAGSDSARHIGDMRPPGVAELFALDAGFASVILWMVAAARAWTTDRRAPGFVRDLLLFLLGTALALTAVRFRAPAALLFLPLAARGAGPGGAALGLALLPTLLLAAQHRVGAPWGTLGVRSLHLAEDAARVLERGTGALWNHYDDGGFLSWRLPGWRIAIDGRTPTYFGSTSHALWRQTTRSAVTFSRLAAANEVTAALVPRDELLCRWLREDAAWRPVYVDLERVLFAKGDAAFAAGLPTLSALPSCDGEPAPTCDDPAAALGEIAALEQLTPGARFPAVARLRLGPCAASPDALAATAATLLADDAGPDRYTALVALAATGHSEEARAELDRALGLDDTPELAMLGVRISGGDMRYWDEAALRWDDAMPLAERLAYARALAAAGRTEEAAEQALRCAWGGREGALELLDSLPLTPAQAASAAELPR
jgi:tetratricopeptide (TPR) repeat protein